MVEPAITIEHVGKRYKLGDVHDGGLQERVDALIRAPARLLGRREPAPAEPNRDFWALRDVSLDVEPGEVLGLIGANGAGKSTLLKLLSRVTIPTEGRLVLRGRVGSLLEVGTGFHPDLSGRDNVYLNGAILGMGRREIDRKFDEIVEFSGIGEFIDTPVKRYSSGMHVRLGFSIAAHLEPEIMLIDEVLAVGDSAFQRKCMGKIEDAARSGRTIVFVSHNPRSVLRLCDRAVWLSHGRIVAAGEPQEIMDAYLGGRTPSGDAGDPIVPDDVRRVGTGEARLRRIEIQGEAGAPVSLVRLGDPLTVRLTFEVFERIEDVCFEVGISTLEGEQIAAVHSIDEGRPATTVEPGTLTVTAEILTALLPHEFVLDGAIHRMNGITVDHVNGAYQFRVLNEAPEGGDKYPWKTVRGYVRPAANWSEFATPEVVDGLAGSEQSLRR